MYIAIYISSKGNYFFNEILENIKEGLTESGHMVIVKNEKDEFSDKYDWNIVIAPHEFFYIDNIQKAPLPKNTIIYNFEQPKLQWFDLSKKYFKDEVIVWDINKKSADKIKAEHPKVSFVPIGYVKSIEQKNTISKLPLNQLTETLDIESMVGNYREKSFDERPIDICFIGSGNDRRKAFFGKYGHFFTKYNCYIHLSEMKPLITGVNTFMGTEISHGIIQRSKIILNIHQGEYPYFEWHRIVNQGVANKTLVVSEKCTDSDLFTGGVDYIECDLNDVTKNIEYYLQKNRESQRIIDVSYEKFKKYTMKNILMAEKYLK